MSEKSNSLINLPDSVDKAINNLTDYPTKNMGQTFGDIWYLVFGGISHAADKKRMKYAADLEKYHKELNEGINNIPEDKRVEPSMQVTAQALENSKYCVSSEILRQMFVKLITGTMHKDLEPHVHPSFPEILKQLSENDAQVLKMMKGHGNASFPVANIGLQAMENNIPKGFTIIFQDIPAKLSENLSSIQCAISISSLARAGLLHTSYTKYKNDDSAYNPIRSDPAYLQVEQMCKYIQNEVYFQKGLCELTNLGHEFIQACVD